MSNVQIHEPCGKHEVVVGSEVASKEIVLNALEIHAHITD